MKVYRGDRTIDGVTVTVDGKPLDPQAGVRAFSSNGFEWSYEGAAPRQLALALLADHWGDPQRALRQHDAFMRAIVANYGNAWEMTSTDMDTAIANILPDAT